MQYCYDSKMVHAVNGAYGPHMTKSMNGIFSKAWAKSITVKLRINLEGLDLHPTYVGQSS